MSYTLLPATLTDVQILGDIFESAFATDAHTLVKLIDQDSKEMVDGMKEAIESWIQKVQRCTITKAVDNNSSTIMGWICWGYHGYEEEQKVKASESSVGAEEEEKESNTENDLAESQDKEMSTGVEEMESITNKDINRWIEKVMPKGSKCMFIVSIAVDPKVQSR